VGHAEFLSRGQQVLISGPQRHALHQRGSEQVDVDPTQTAPVQTPDADQFNYLGVRNGLGLVVKQVISQKTFAPTPIANQELAVYQRMPGDLIELPKPG
jgi:hypothetical protein